MLSANLSSAVIYGLEGLEVSASEAEFFKKVNPLGFILFARNIDNPAQVKALVNNLREIVGWECPILIDQEGGRVARLKEPNWPKFPAMEKFADIAKEDIIKAENESYENAKAIAKELFALGINVDCAPVADLRVDGAHDIIGDRSFGADSEIVARLARKMAEGLHDGGVLSIIKHVPGHGRALADSHEDLPVVDSSLSVLEQTDFKVFNLLKDLPWAMTAHIIFTALDKDLPVTLSAKAINYIRQEIDFQGVLVSDDLSMKALKGSYEERTEKSLSAGCDIVLHCNGKMKEMTAIANAIKPMSEIALGRFEKSLDFMVAVA